MITVDKFRCQGCGSCVQICHEGCIELIGGTASIRHELCSTCTQCIAICPQRALAWDHVPPVAFDEARLPTADQLDELFKERRTIRFFREDPIDRALLEEIVGYGIHAPTNNYHLRAIVVDDRAIMEELERVHLRFVSWIYRLIYRPRVVFSLLSMITPGLDRKDKVKMEEALERGLAVQQPPAMVVIIGDRRIALSEVSAQYALYNTMLYAQVKGIGSRLRGMGQIFFDRSRAARRCLGLRREEHILGMAELGYPAVRFRNKVAGKMLPIQWNAG